MATVAGRGGDAGGYTTPGNRRADPHHRFESARDEPGAPRVRRGGHPRGSQQPRRPEEFRSSCASRVAITHDQRCLTTNPPGATDRHYSDRAWAADDRNLMARIGRNQAASKNTEIPAR